MSKVLKVSKLNQVPFSRNENSQAGYSTGSLPIKTGVSLSLLTWHLPLSRPSFNHLQKKTRKNKQVNVQVHKILEEKKQELCKSRKNFYLFT